MLTSLFFVGTLESMRTDTIAAIATPLGEGGIGIVRVSGSAAFPIAERLFRRRGGSKPLQSHRAYFGRDCRPPLQARRWIARCCCRSAPRAATRARMWRSSTATAVRTCCAVCWS
jgi:tRNA modification GTPase